jgi:hypothetical protein
MSGPCLFGLLVFALVMCMGLVFVRANKSREGFKVLGTLGNQPDLYYNCLSECERTDPRKQMGLTHGSMSCQSYCESTITDMVRRGGPSYPNDFPIKEIPIVTRVDQSFVRCGQGTKGEWCRSLFATDGEIDQRCRQNCEFSTDQYPGCMKKCANSYEGNRYMGWNWK